MNKNPKALPLGLILEEGLPNEIISSRLDSEKIKYFTYWDKENNGYFRSSTITINVMSGLSFQQRKQLSREEKDRIINRSKTRIIEILGYPNNVNLGKYSYFSIYRICPDFNWPNITGRVKFVRGSLIERVMLDFQ
ncbi:hypothetical protein J4217_04005 [Candidatus Pacearchaeota archaeon]|nr:hypothetical protein [uncultured archaeon]AQS33197.1 hypothetical protein [uncultured archaeon]MBS3091583.1 hypothetical protein [Candidatus Pacearchaeota archaeon]